MKLRELKIEDFGDVNELYFNLHMLHVERRPDIYRGISKPTTPRAWDFEVSLEDANVLFFGAEEDGRIIGFCKIVTDEKKSGALTPRKFAVLEEIAVDEKYRRRGVGRALYLEACRAAKERGASAIELKGWSFNGNAKAFYSSLGMSVQSCIMEQKL